MGKQDNAGRFERAQGFINIKTDEGKRAATVIASMPVKENEHLMLVTDGGQLIRTRVDQIRIAGRATMGVIVFRTDKNEKVVSATCFDGMEEESDLEEAMTPEENSTTSEENPTHEQSEAQ